jgi:protein phosphatase
VGRVRPINQDLPLESANLFAVADGMGGHVAGEVAARVAIETLQLAFDRDPTSTGLRGAFVEANEAVWHESQFNPEVRGMGTTLIAVALVSAASGGDTLTLANVGDSRAYVLAGGSISQVTSDHSLAEERARHGEMTEAEAAVHPQRHILTRAMGIGPDVDVDMWDLQLQSGDRVVLCSDGLSNEVSMDLMAQVLAREPDPTRAAQRLVDQANERGGSDNITVVVVDVLVGEDDTDATSLVTPLGALAEAEAPVVLAGGAATGAATPVDTATIPLVSPVPGTDDTMAVPRLGSLAPGSQLGFSGSDTGLGEAATASGEFLSGQTASVPLARTSARVPPQPTRSAIVPPKETRGQRRRRLGIPRRITVRVVLFLILIAAVPVGAFFAIRWYSYDNWYPAISGTHVVIEQGHSGGVLWFQPKVVDRTGITTSEILPPGLAEIRSVQQEPSLSDAKHFVQNLHAQYVFLHSAAATNSGTGTIGPNGSLPNITAPKTTTTTKPGETTVPTAAVTTTTVAQP